MRAEKKQTGQSGTASNKETECVLMLGLKQPLSSGLKFIIFLPLVPSDTKNVLVVIPLVNRGAQIFLVERLLQL